MNGQKTLYHAKIKFLKAAVVIVILDKVDFRAKNNTRENKAHFIMIIWSIYLKKYIIRNIYASNNIAIKISKVKTVRTERKNKKIHNIVGEFDTLS